MKTHMTLSQCCSWTLDGTTAASTKAQHHGEVPESYLILLLEICSRKAKLIECAQTCAAEYELYFIAEDPWQAATY